MRHRFEQSQRQERRWAAHLDRWLLESGYAVTPATVDDEWRGIDRWTVGDDGVSTSVEYKLDARAQETGRVFVEVVSSTRTHRDGWALTCTADWLLYWCVPAVVYVCRPPVIRAMVPRWRHTYPLRAAHNEGYDTLGLCVPLGVFRAVAESISDARQRDGIVLQDRLPATEAARHP